MNPRVKICGITRPEDADICCREDVHALGFIFYRESPRFVPAGTARAIIRDLPPFVTPVGVFVNASRDFILEAIGETGIRALQLSGDERPEDCEGFPVKVIKAFRFTTPGEAAVAGEYPVSAALLDGAGNGLYGGSGNRADVEVALAVKEYRPLILAGGLNPENVAEAVRAVRPYAVDVNSGIESAPGRKDPALVRLLFNRLSQLH